MLSKSWTETLKAKMSHVSESYESFNCDGPRGRKQNKHLEKMKSQMITVSKVHKGVQSEGNAWPECGFTAVMEKRSYIIELHCIVVELFSSLLP